MEVKTEQFDVTSTEQKEINSVGTSETMNKEDVKESESSTIETKEVCVFFTF